MGSQHSDAASSRLPDWSAHYARRGQKSLHQPLWDDVPVGTVEELFLHMVVQAWARRIWWVLVIKDQLRCLVVSRLQEAHYLACIRSL